MSQPPNNSIQGTASKLASLPSVGAPDLKNQQQFSSGINGSFRGWFRVIRRIANVLTAPPVAVRLRATSSRRTSDKMVVHGPNGNSPGEAVFRAAVLPAGERRLMAATCPMPTAHRLDRGTRPRLPFDVVMGKRQLSEWPRHRGLKTAWGVVSRSGCSGGASPSRGVTIPTSNPVTTLRHAHRRARRTDYRDAGVQGSASSAWRGDEAIGPAEHYYLQCSVRRVGSFAIPASIQPEP